MSEIEKAIEELKPCPICGKKLTVRGPEDWKPTFYDPDSGGDPYEATCECGFQFSIGTCEYDEFVKAINRRTEQENNPLSLEELRQMDTKPVYCVGIKNKALDGWGLVYLAGEEIIDSTCSFWQFDEYEKEYIAYSHKPKEEK